MRRTKFTYRYIRRLEGDDLYINPRWIFLYQLKPQPTLQELYKVLHPINRQSIAKKHCGFVRCEIPQGSGKYEDRYDCEKPLTVPKNR